MEILPKTLGTRPRLAVEVRAEGVVAARAEDAAAVLTAVSRADLPEGAVAPGLRAGNFVDKTAVVGAVRRTLDGVVPGGRERSRDVTVVVPDAAARVLLLEFEELPSKAVEALPVVRFTTAERLFEIVAIYEKHGVFVANPHVYTLEEGSRHKRADADQLGFKAEVDPYGLLNPGKMRSYVPAKWEPVSECQQESAGIPSPLVG